MIYINIYITKFRLSVKAIVRLPLPWSGDSQGQVTFLAPSADNLYMYVYIIYT